MKSFYFLVLLVLMCFVILVGCNNIDIKNNKSHSSNFSGILLTGKIKTYKRKFNNDGNRNNFNVIVEVEKNNSMKMQVKNQEKVIISGNRKEVSYKDRLKNLLNFGINEYSKLYFASHIDCFEFCGGGTSTGDNIDFIKCLSECNKEKKAARDKIKQIKIKEKYPQQCFKDAENYYNSLIKDVPEGIKLPPKEKIIKDYAHKCILIYGFTNSNCELIKTYKEPYEHCKRLMQLMVDLQILDQRQDKTFEDYLKEGLLY